ncbi:hypothetical protein [Owenweeksia hongkongensis]|uniref:Outer membrane protein beta-barrel domain-containing protein n=1 Tax=Owenweeksia hongkongensis (strain DSM 17368 / CIP 108786 / JCM 12287 / NRRL B-23963 / UST20020801) TaxID=926562 RepID=G8R4I9_OWEHD|nr:hypothetical protein [Owenweeksia hongkongensis]AEV32078.1 hypothetical protein Oweho_1071 [Owenweeksia hongkongensis DSM 17368]
MRFLYILTLSICIPAALLAQKNVPGYMGKKWNFQYQAYLYPSFNNPNGEEPNIVSADEIDVPTSLNFQNHFSIAYTISKRMEVLAEFSAAKTNFDPYHSFIYEMDVAKVYYPEMKARGGAVGIRLYTKHFAPLGSYFAFKIGYTKVTADDLNYSIVDFYTGGPDEDYTIEGGSKGAPTLTASFGNNRIIADRFIFSYGIDFTFFAGGIFNWKPLLADESRGDYIEFGYPETYNDENQEAYLKKAAARYAMMSMINVKIGVGFLL